MPEDDMRGAWFPDCFSIFIKPGCGRNLRELQPEMVEIDQEVLSRIKG
jgi:hypothetical protein